MAEQADRANAPLLGERVDEGGQGAVVASVRAAKAAIEDGSTPGFTDLEAMLHYLGRRSAG